MKKTVYNVLHKRRCLRNSPEYLIYQDIHLAPSLSRQFSPAAIAVRSSIVVPVVVSVGGGDVARPLNDLVAKSRTYNIG